MVHGTTIHGCAVQRHACSTGTQLYTGYTGKGDKRRGRAHMQPRTPARPHERETKSGPDTNLGTRTRGILLYLILANQSISTFGGRLFNPGTTQHQPYYSTGIFVIYVSHMVGFLAHRVNRSTQFESHSRSTMVDTTGCLRGFWLGVGLLVVCFLYKTNPNPRKTICRGEKVAQMPLLTWFFLGWVGLLGWGVRRFHNDICMCSNPA